MHRERSPGIMKYEFDLSYFLKINNLSLEAKLDYYYYYYC